MIFTLHWTQRPLEIERYERRCTVPASRMTSSRNVRSPYMFRRSSWMRRSFETRGGSGLLSTSSAVFLRFTAPTPPVLAISFATLSSCDAISTRTRGVNLSLTKDHVRTTESRKYFLLLLFGKNTGIYYKVNNGVFTWSVFIRYLPFHHLVITSLLWLPRPSRGKYHKVR